MRVNGNRFESFKHHPLVTIACLTPAVCSLAGCASLSTGSSKSLPEGDAAYTMLEQYAPEPRQTRIRPTDILNVKVLFEPDLSRDSLRVDAGGMIQLPLVGSLKAAGLTSQELSSEIYKELLPYLKQPQVDVSIASTLGDRITIEGNVNDPGSFDVAGSATLLEVIARAKSPNKLAKLNEIVVFRTVDDQRVAAVFDLNRIRRGIDRDPKLYPGDMVVVGYSFVKGAYRDFFMIAPVLGIFARY